LSVKKLRVGVIYGGRSGEHEVSIASAAAVFKNLPRSLYEPVAIRIDKDGRWNLPDRPPTALAASEVIEQGRLASAHPVRPGREAHLVAYPAEDTVLTIDRRKGAKSDADESARITGLGLDVVFPVLHGPHGEDGTVQGLLELSNVPYVGAGVLASAVGMDKAFMKIAFAARGLPIADYRVLLFMEWTAHRDATLASVESLGYPVFVKPANLGSSVGISKARSRQELATAIDLAFEYDRKVVIEAAVPAARELEVGVLGNDTPEASVAGEVIPGREFYDYEAKYLDSGSTTRVPAELDEGQHAELKRLAIEAFKAVDCAGMARVDFLLSKDTGRLYVNEINTIPGFTTISMYSQLWAASGVDYPALLDRLIKLAVERHAEKQRLKTSAS
jgi:D-alanine-D-alanine ligase